MKRSRALVWPFSALLVLLLLTLGVVGAVYLSRHHNSSSSKKQIPESQVQGQETSNTSGWDEVSKLTEYTTEQLVSYLSPLVTMSNNAYYMSQAGSVSGWKLSPSVQPLEASSSGGATALVYEENTSSRPRLVAAFRGTSTRQDMCVDRLMFGDLPPVPLPSESYCISTYTNQSLDYVSQGVTYIRKVREAYPGSPLVLTGHSLGGSLAVLVSASLLSAQEVIPVVGFSSPGAKNAMESRSLELSPEMKRKTFIIGDQWDGITTGFPQVGSVCLVEHKRPSGCEGCSAKDTSPTCSSCAFQAHSLTGILDNLKGGAKVACSIQ